MLEITRAQLDMLKGWFDPEVPGPLIAPHIIHTGAGRAWVDHWPDVQTIVVETNYNYAMVGEPKALAPTSLTATIAGFVTAPPSFLPLLEGTFPTLAKWQRVIGVLPDSPYKPTIPPSADFRRIQPEDAYDLDMLSAESIWVSQTWGGGAALAQSGYGWGAWVDGVLASVACTFFLGNHYEDIGIVTEAPYRAEGLGTACAYALCLDTIARGRKPSWTTSTDNPASWRVAQKLGFIHQRDDWLYIVGRDAPKQDG